MVVRIVAIEGGIAVGKTTIMHMLSQDGVVGDWHVRIIPEDVDVWQGGFAPNHGVRGHASPAPSSNVLDCF